MELQKNKLQEFFRYLISGFIRKEVNYEKSN